MVGLSMYCLNGVFNRTASVLKGCKKERLYTMAGPTLVPFISSLAIFLLFMSAGLMWSGIESWKAVLYGGGAIGLMSMYSWLGKVVFETKSKLHSFTYGKTMILGLGVGASAKDISGLKLGFFLFICSELFFFGGGFWAWFNCMIGEISRGSAWPPLPVSPPHPFEAPLVGTVVLLVSGIAVTKSYKLAAKQKDLKSSAFLFLTCVLGSVFLLIQLEEFSSLEMKIQDSSYSCCFYFLTGLHGLHVAAGVVFMLCVGLSRSPGWPTLSVGLGTKLSGWYWHFVDVVWLAVYLAVYVWTYYEWVYA
nr:COX3 [Donax trunculus]